MNHWYVIKTKPQKEDSVSQLLTNAHFEVLCPKIRSISYGKKTSHFQIRPLFPSYLFLNIDFEDKRNFHLIKYTRGVSRILCAENKPLPLNENIIQTIKQRINTDGVIERPSGLKPGDPIRVKKGMLKDLIGILEKPSSDKERVVVLLNLINYNMKATLHWSEIEKIRAA